MKTLTRTALLLALASTAVWAQVNMGEKQAEADLPFTVTQVTTFNLPWRIAFLPDGRMLVTEKPGAVWLVTQQGAKTPVSNVPAVLHQGQGGLLGIFTSPKYASDHRVYLTYAEPGDYGSGLALARAKLEIGQTAASLDGLEVLWRQLAKGKGGQFGAQIAFSPDGQYLFLTVGDRQRFTPAQDPNQELGKILRLTLDGKPAPGNPWAGRTGAATVRVTDPPEDSEAAKTARARTITWPGTNLTPAETWTLGHRNPLGLAFAPDGRLWEIEMGPRGGDELNLIIAGRNYGYPIVSNGDNYNGVPIPDHHPGDGFEPPEVYWNPVISPGGLLIYTGDLFPQWKGDALIPALSGEALVHVNIDGDKATKADQWDMGKRIRALDEGPHGEVYLLEDGPGARLLRLTPAK